MTGRTVLRALAGTLVLGTFACAPARPRLPQGPWSPAPEAVEWFTEASGRCASVRTLTAEIAVVGRAGETRVRGRLIAGLERAGSLRLEAPAPFGAPAFILAARDVETVLYFPRDGRVLTGASVADVLEALAGIRRGAGDLHALLSGCLVADRRPSNGRVAGTAWAQVDLGGGVAAFLRNTDGRWAIAGGRQPADVSRSDRGSWAVEYTAVVAGLPRAILFSSGEADSKGGIAATLSLTLSQLETNVPIAPSAFTLGVPPGTLPLSLEELRQMGPLADRRAGRDR
ncbi:MAG: hypothetical protein AB1806_18690 [Acidobacteriota bacterium]